MSAWRGATQPGRQHGRERHAQEMPSALHATRCSMPQRAAPRNTIVYSTMHTGAHQLVAVVAHRPQVLEWRALDRVDHIVGQQVQRVVWVASITRHQRSHQLGRAACREVRRGHAAAGAQTRGRAAGGLGELLTAAAAAKLLNPPTLLLLAAATATVPCLNARTRSHAPLLAPVVLCQRPRLLRPRWRPLLMRRVFIKVALMQHVLIPARVSVERVPRERE